MIPLLFSRLAVVAELAELNFTSERGFPVFSLPEGAEVIPAWESLAVCLRCACDRPFISPIWTRNK